MDTSEKNLTNFSTLKVDNNDHGDRWRDKDAEGRPTNYLLLPTAYSLLNSAAPTLIITTNYFKVGSAYMFTKEVKSIS